MLCKKSEQLSISGKLEPRYPRYVKRCMVKCVSCRVSPVSALVMNGSTHVQGCPSQFLQAGRMNVGQAVIQHCDSVPDCLSSHPEHRFPVFLRGRPLTQRAQDHTEEKTPGYARASTMERASDHSKSVSTRDSSEDICASRKSSEACSEDHGLLDQDEVQLKKSRPFSQRRIGFICCHFVLFVAYLVTMAALAVSHSSIQKELRKPSLYCAFSRKPHLAPANCASSGKQSNSVDSGSLASRRWVDRALCWIPKTGA